ncbi:hypothetical protein ACFSX5_01135 [Devosia albogilva]|uniref:Uncharacterized protein n=1 Tax=Devosia albogilva TaxID=429726 RepID=A0ABW5QF27_9HYPH
MALSHPDGSMRFHVQPRCVPPAVAARRIGLSEARFRDLAGDLLGHGFPLPDPVTGNYDLEAIDRYIDRRNAELLAKEPEDDGPLTDSNVIMARIAAMGR